MIERKRNLEISRKVANDLGTFRRDWIFAPDSRRYLFPHIRSSSIKQRNMTCPRRSIYQTVTREARQRVFINARFSRASSPFSVSRAGARARNGVLIITRRINPRELAYTRICTRVPSRRRTQIFVEDRLSRKISLASVDYFYSHSPRIHWRSAYRRGKPQESVRNDFQLRVSKHLYDSDVKIVNTSREIVGVILHLVTKTLRRCKTFLRVVSAC